MRRWLTIIASFILLSGLLVGCTEGGQDDATKSETKIRKGTYQALVAAQPAHSMSYSSSRDTINFWIDTWGNQPGKLSYVYLLASNGQMIGYYVFKGLPVSYCAALTPNYDLIDVRDDGIGPNLIVPAPGVDGVYYSGGQCSAYYGKDASTNQYIEYTIGQGISALVYERPLPRQDVEPLGFTRIPER